MKKVYVRVSAVFDETGHIWPQKIFFEDGLCYPIDQVLDVRRAASLKVGGAGLRYTVRIRQNRTQLFLEENRWFVEAKAPQDSTQKP